MRIWCGFLAVAALTSCSPREHELHKRQLPGFSLDVPAFVEVKPELSYRDDEIQADQGMLGISVSWSEGGTLDPAGLNMTVKALMETAAKGEDVELDPARSPTIGGQQAVQVEGNIGGIARFSFTNVVCGGRSVMIGIVGGASFEKLRDRMLGSFACTPVAADEKQLGSTTPIGVDDPTTLAGFRYVDQDRSQFSITNGELIAIFDTTSADSESMELMTKLLPNLLGAGANVTMDRDGRAVRSVGSASRSFEQGSMKNEDGTRNGVVTSLWRCDGDKQAVFAIVVVLFDTDRTKAIDWLSKIRCARPGDPPLAIAADAGEPPDEQGSAGSADPAAAPHDAGGKSAGKQPAGKQPAGKQPAAKQSTRSK